MGASPNETGRASSAFSKDGGLELESGFVVSYSVAALMTPRVFFMMTGTILENKLLWLNQCGIMLVFTSCAALFIFWPLQNFGKWVNLMDDHTEIFLIALQTMAALLLTFYVSLSVSRWWDLRFLGVRNIETASQELLLFISRFVTRDKQVLSAIRRYTKASLLLIFCERTDNVTIAHLRDLRILEEEELEQLQHMTNAPKSIWAWITEIVAKLHKD